MSAVGDRVIALRNMTNDTAYIYGVGVYEGELEPPFGPLGTSKEKADKVVKEMIAAGVLPEGYKFLNPCISIPGKGVVWGSECWWGSEDAVTRKIGLRKVVEVPLPDRQCN